ncbi:Transposon Tf2-9 poly [Paramuricea clavata]|uniref:Transposon Tf2-9 poly n=1 Tax=Paramuricea clavata TaxID=317549 RepID=A0A6S7GGZ8_PARCT|nr:Transposon Tf2-9 poly [Paramuricea clavata]
MILSKNGIRPDQEKVVAIKNTPAPNNVKELRSFLGLVNYCSKFIPNFSTVTAPLRKLDRKKVPWKWDASHQEIKSVAVDASPVDLGAILVQHDEQGILKVIAFASRALTVVENRTVRQNEKRWHRWALRLQQLTTRSSIVQAQGIWQTSEPSGQSIAEEYINFITEQAIPRTITLSEVQEATKNDKELQSVGRALQFGNWKDKSISAYFAARHEITSTKQNLRTKVWWPRLDKEAEQHVKECLTCQISGNPEPPPSLAVVPPPMAPWSCIHVDFYGPAPTGEHLLVLLDETTGFPEVEIMNKTTAFHTIQAFEKANEKVEGFMKPMGKAIRAAWAEGRVWHRELFAFLMNYRTTSHLSTGVAPAEMLYKRVIRSTVTSFSQVPANTAAERVLKGKAKSKQYVDARRRTRKSTIKEGDTVLVKEQDVEINNDFEDITSRAPLPTTDSELEKEISSYIHMVMSNLPATDDMMARLRMATEEEETLRQLKKTVLSGWPDTKRETPVKIREYCHCREEISEIDGILLKNEKIIIPSFFRP